MKKNFLYTALFALMLASCSEQEVIEQPSTPTGGTEVQLPADVTSGELLIKFDPAMTEILDQALTVATRSGGAMTRSGIPSTDEVLDILGTYHFAFGVFSFSIFCGNGYTSPKIKTAYFPFSSSFSSFTASAIGP